MNMRLGGICLLLAAVAMTAGCLDQSKSEPQAKPKPQVAVVNLDTIADAMGMKAEVAGQIQADEQGLRQQLAQIQQSLQKQLQEKRAAYGEEMTEDQQKELTQLVNQANAQMNQLRQRAQALAMQNRQQKIAQARAQIQPFVEQVAKTRGATIVTERQFVFWTDDSVDITSDVIAKWKLEGGKTPAISTTKPAPAADGGTPAEATTPAGDNQ